MARKWIAASIMAMAFLFGSAALGQEFSGAFYVGDSNGNGVIEPADVARAQQKYATGSADYSQVEPPVWDVAELNGNGFIDPADFLILQYWYITQFPARTGLPATITAVGSTTVNINSGDSVVVCVEVRDSAFSGDMNATDRAGWGVNFRVDQTAGLCTTATIYGRNPWGSVKDEYGYFQKAYEYTDRMAPNGHGRACVRVVAPLFGCEGLEIKVNTYIPGDSEAMCNYQPSPCFGTIGRFWTQLDGPTFTITPIWADCFLHITPNPAIVNDGESLQFTATDDCDGDVTASAVWSVQSGPCIIAGATPGKIWAPEGCANAACVVDASYPMSVGDLANVDVIDDEAGSWDSLTGLVCAPVNDGASMLGACSGARRVSSADGCDRGPASCAISCTAGCAGTNVTEACVNGTYTGRCADGAYNVSDGGTAIDNEAGTWNMLTNMVCSPVESGSSIFGACAGTRRRSMADGCDRGAAACSYGCLQGCSGMYFDEVCEDTPYTMRCMDGAYSIQDSSTILDPTGGTWNALAGLVCSPRNDGQSMLTACSGARRIHSATGCDMGPAACVYDCTSGCAGTDTTELCMPTTSGSYTGRCTDSTVSISDSATVTNNEQIASVNVSPEGPVNLMEGATAAFACAATYADACSRSCNAALTDQAGCGSLAGTLYTGAGAPCTDVVSADFDAGTDGETVTVIGDAFLLVSPDPGTVNDGEDITFTAWDSSDGDVTQSPNTTWSIVSGPCAVLNAIPNKGRVTPDEGCSDSACVVRAVYNPGVSREDDAGLNVSDNDVADTVDTDCPTLDDGDGVWCSADLYSSADGCLRAASQPCELTSCDAGCDFGNWTDEGCVDYSYMATCVFWDIGSDSCWGQVIDDEYCGYSTPAINNWIIELVLNGGTTSAEWVEDGHTLELQVGEPCINVAPGDFDCFMRLVNRDSDEYMANVFMTFPECPSCATAFLHQPSFCTGASCFFYGDTVPIGNAGFTYAEDGYGYNNPPVYAPFNQYGGDLHPVPASNTKPFQYLHPKAGQRSMLWSLRGQSSPYTFFASVTADWFPWNPLGPNGAAGGGDDDPRYDFQNFTTIYLMLADFSHKISYSQYYARGAWKRSNILAGYSAPGMKSGATVTAGSYFSVNVGIEYPDRIEGRVMGAPAVFDTVNGYEYYNLYAVFFRWDPAVVSPVSANRAGGVYTGPRLPCWTQGNCDNLGYQASQHLTVFNPSIHGAIDATNGFIYFYRDIAGNFAWYNTTQTYRTDGGGQINIGYGNNREGGHNGVAIWDRSYLGWTIMSVSPASANGRAQQGPDPDPEQNLLNYHFWVKPGTSGRATEIMADTYAGYTSFILSHTGATFYPSGPGEPTDWASYCAPYSPGHANPADQHCDPAKSQSEYAVYHGQENVNTAIGHSGELVFGGTGSAGGVQQWPVYIVVQ